MNLTNKLCLYYEKRVEELVETQEIVPSALNSHNPQNSGDESIPQFDVPNIQDYRGIKNITNSCYAASVIQMLVHCPTIGNIIANEHSCKI